MSENRIDNISDTLGRAKCCYANKVIDINKKRNKTLKSSKLDEDYWDAFYLRFYIDAIDNAAFRSQLGDTKVSEIIDRINEKCEC